MRTQGTCLLNNGKKRTRPHSPFTSKKMDCECLGFIHFPKACDPVHFSGYIVKQIQEGKPGYGLRFIQRITPVSMTCSATNPELFEKMAKKLLEPQFGIKFCPRKSETVVENLENPLRVGLKFRIESIVRCHDKPLNRSEVIRIIGDVVKRYNEDDFIMASDEDSVGHDPVKLKHKVDISDSDIVILVSVYRYVAGLSVVRNYDREGKRFNLQAIAQAREQATSNNSNSETIDKKKVAHS
ncbi:expressed protein [Phakopsora pachyrhizi]|uniref:Expressed protein n=1 Tax=Phakopsora pachyrhizi TaxID=170000 RepID=A0AAV0AW39_PHAPC|nr:expressed protein [Phakopsora pachyrhizi]